MVCQCGSMGAAERTVPVLQAMKAVRALEGWLREESRATEEARLDAISGREGDEDAMRTCLHELTQAKVRGGTALKCVYMSRDVTKGPPKLRCYLPKHCII